MERLGLGWERLHELNPRVIYISLSGFGHSGRNAHYVTWGPTAQALSGVTYMSGLPDQPPAGWGFSYLDHTAGFYGAIAALMALHHRERTGEGQCIDISQVETGMVLCGVPVLDFQVNGRRYQRAGNGSRWPALAPHGVYRCRDSDEGADRWIAIAVETEAHWRALCDVLGAAELLTDERFASNLKRVQHQGELDSALTLHTRRFDTHELMYLLQARGVPAGTAQNARDKMEHDPQLQHRGFYVAADHGELGRHQFEGLPLRFSDARWEVHRGGPCLGEHTLEVLTQLLGYSEADVEELRAEAAL
jgi:crotonobetainyl-CoA:carnitine CoA-transferase CaiB-like acyl-CoA transferase